MYDATIMMRERACGRSTILVRLGLAPGEFQLATLHRAENTDSRDALERALAYLQRASQEQPLVLPLHPRTRNAAASFGIEISGIRVIEPVGYLDMIALLDGCTRVLTDSGGLQKEAYFFRKPCVTLRDATEWVETIEAGWNRLWTRAGLRTATRKSRPMVTVTPQEKSPIFSPMRSRRAREPHPTAYSLRAVHRQPVLF